MISMIILQGNLMMMSSVQMSRIWNKKKRIRVTIVLLINGFSPKSKWRNFVVMMEMRVMLAMKYLNERIIDLSVSN